MVPKILVCIHNTPHIFTHSGHRLTCDFLRNCTSPETVRVHWDETRFYCWKCRQWAEFFSLHPMKVPVHKIPFCFKICMTGVLSSFVLCRLTCGSFVALRREAAVSNRTEIVTVAAHKSDTFQLLPWVGFGYVLSPEYYDENLDIVYHLIVLKCDSERRGNISGGYSIRHFEKENFVWTCV
jgi:hypothetical protein